MKAVIDGTGHEFARFWSTASEEGFMNPNTARNYKVAVERVLGVTAGWESVDVRSLDLDGLLEKFRRRYQKEFNPITLNTYEGRFKAAFSSFVRYLDDPERWRTERSEDSHNRLLADPDVARASSRMAGLVAYPFPLRDGRFAYLRLPADLSKAEARRLSAYLNSLAMDEEGEEKA